MPSQLPISTIRDLVAAWHRGVKAKRNKREDGHSGSAYDYIAGPSAMLLARQSAFIRDLFRAKYFDDAEGQDLTNYVAGRYGIARIVDGYGPGTATLMRANAAADAGQPQGVRTIWEGTRIQIQGTPTSSPQIYAVAADTPVASGALYVAGLPIRGTTYGAGSAINTAVSQQPAVIVDPLWDPSFKVTSLQCADGTVFEQAPAFRARVRALLQEALPGYTLGIQDACQAAGAVNVPVFGTTFGGYDLGACAVYVGDAGFVGSQNLVRACSVTLESWRMCGAYTLVAPMQPVAQPVTATIQLYDDPSKFDLTTLTTAASGAISNVFGATGAYGYDLDAIFGAIVLVSDAIQNVTFTQPTGSSTLLVGSPLWFPQVLSRYAIPPNGITLSYVGPSA